jgi:hypothetical protein
MLITTMVPITILEQSSFICLAFITGANQSCW